MKQVLHKLLGGAFLTTALLLAPGFLNLAQAQTTVTIGGSGSATASYFPNYYLYNYTYAQSIYTAAELTTGGAPAGGGSITKIRFKSTASVSTVDWQDWVVYMGNTPKEGFNSTTDWIALGSLTQVFSGTIPSSVTSGTWMEITLTTPFLWDGSSNLVVAVEENTPDWGGNPSWAGYTLAPSAGNKVIYFYSDGTNPDPASPPTATSRTNITAQVQFDITPAAACNSTPAASITSSATATCGDIPFSLNAAPSGMSGLTYLFQFSADGGANWNNLGTAGTASIYTISTQTATTQYRVIVTCAGNGSDTSASVTVTQNPASACFCTPATTGGSSNYITNFTTTGGTTNINKSSAGSATGYQDFHTTDTASAYQGATIDYSISVSSGTYGRAIWIDFNEDGLFDPTEQVASSSSYSGTPLTGSFTIPFGATPGNKRMRVLASWTPSNPSNPCTNSGSGEYEDYTFNVLELTPCTGTPAAVVASTVTEVCEGVPFDLSATPEGMSGLSYLFQVSTNGGTFWSDLSTSSLVPDFTVANQLTTSQYRVIVTCAGGGSDTSAAITVAQTPAAACYCLPTTTGGTTYYISNFTTTGGATNINNSSTGSATGYQDFHGTDTASAYQGATVSYNMTVAGGSTYGRAIWIDFDEDGVFDPTEQVVSSTSYASSPLTGSFTIPLGTTPGNKRMRILASFTPSNPSNPCSNTGSGEYEDYTFNVLELAPCTGTPAAVVASSVTEVCEGVPFDLSATPEGMSGLSYLFQVSTNGGTFWSDLSTSSLVPDFTVANQLTTSQYRVIVTCAGGGSDTSAAVTVAQNPPSTCYCVPTTSGGNTYYISNFTTTGGTTNINKSSTGSATGYQDFHGTDTLVAPLGTTVNYTMTVAGGSTYGRAIWIDFNENGVFEATEQIVSSTGYVTSPLTGSFTIPLTSAPGIKRMRILASFTPSNPSNPCTNSGSGEYEDYTVNIQALSSCSGTPTAGLTSNETLVCGGTPITLTATPSGLGGLTYTYQVSTDGGTNWTGLAVGTIAPQYTVASQTVTSQYRVIVTCAIGGSDTSAAVTVTQKSFDDCICTPTTSGGSTYYISNFTTTGAVININKSSGGSPTGYQDFHATDFAAAAPGATVNYTMTVAGGSTYGRAIWIDFNEDGVFDPTEKVVSSTSYASSPLTGSFTIPAAAPGGTKRMRILASFTPANPNNPCINSGSGEYEDYTMEIGIPAPCTGNPLAGTLQAAQDTLCPGSTVALTMTDFDLFASGLSFQWQQSANANGPFTDVTGGAGATTTSYTTATLSDSMYYRVKITCAGSGGISYSDTLLVNVIDTSLISVTPGGSCVTAPVTLSATAAAGATVQWWSSPTSTTPLATGPTFTTPIISVTTTYYVSTTTVAGCSSSRIPVQALIGGSPTITTQPTGDTVCNGQPFTLSVSATGGAAYQWYGPGGIITGATSPTYTLPAATAANTGAYVVEVMGAPGCGSAVSDAALVSVGANGTWRGFTADWDDTNNWCGGLPTATTDVIIPNTGSVPFSPVVAIGVNAQVRDIAIENSTLTVAGALSIYGNVSSAGGGTVNAPGGTITLAGSSAQNITTGFEAATLNVSGGGQKNIGNDVVITNELALNSGLVNMHNATLSLVPGATISGGSAASYVKTENPLMGGLKQTVGNTPAFYPVGSSAYNPATISNSGTPQATLVRVRDEVLEYGYTGAPLNTAAATYVINRTWDIEADVTGTTDATLTLQWNAGEENSSSFDYNHVYIAHYVGGGWENTCCPNAIMAPPANGSGPYTVTQTGISHFSPFTVGSAGGDPLHVSTATQSGFTMTAYPNPVSDVLTVKVDGGTQQGQVSLIDMTGRELMARFVENGRALFELKALPAGVYFVRYNDGKYMQTLKVNKQ